MNKNGKVDSYYIHGELTEIDLKTNKFKQYGEGDVRDIQIKLDYDTDVTIPAIIDKIVRTRNSIITYYKFKIKGVASEGYYERYLLNYEGE